MHFLVLFGTHHEDYLSKNCNTIRACNVKCRAIADINGTSNSETITQNVFCLRVSYVPQKELRI